VALGVQYSVADPESDRDLFQNEHILNTMCRFAGMTGTIELRPYLSLSADEKKSGKLFERQAVIQSAGLATGPGVMKNKDWFPERFQGVSDALGSSLKLIQLGQTTDPPLQGTLDLRGKTTLRESAAILASSKVFIGLVGFLMHLARAVDCRSVIVYGGREAPSVSGYEANENIVGHTVCSPCWQRNKCDYDRECMRMIGVDEVVAAVRRQLALAGTPLKTETINLDFVENTTTKGLETNS
jgi:ADP-heptose:LPS heptosyltransferase